MTFDLKYDPATTTTITTSKNSLEFFSLEVNSKIALKSPQVTFVTRSKRRFLICYLRKKKVSKLMIMNTTKELLVELTEAVKPIQVIVIDTNKPHPMQC